MTARGWGNIYIGAKIARELGELKTAADWKKRLLLPDEYHIDRVQFDAAYDRWDIRVESDTIPVSLHGFEVVPWYVKEDGVAKLQSLKLHEKTS